MSRSLRLVTAFPADPQVTEPEVWFCGHCGKRSEEQISLNARVCDGCSMGLMISAAESVAPQPSDAFLVVDGTLTVCAVSKKAERLLGSSESDVVNRHIGEFLIPADAEAGAAGNLASMVAAAASGHDPATTVHVRPANTFGVRFAARVGACGPPSAALLVLS